jgi:coniferyl-aldehyde dehydrogenase
MSTTAAQTDAVPGAGDAIAEMRRVYDLQRRACAASAPPDLRARLGSLDRLAEAVGENSPALADAISADFGHRSIYETSLLELVPLQNAIRHAKQNLRRWMRPERRRVAWTFKPSRSWIQYQPLGIVGIVSPWNYPLSLALVPVVDAMAAGNRVLLKTSDQMPAFSKLLKSLLARAFDESELAVLVGGVDLAEQFVRLPLDHILFTGSAAVGRKVLAAAAENLTPVTLELGGKSPVVVCPDYDVAVAARDITFPKLANAGQTCLAPDYVLAPAPKVEALGQAIIAEARRLYPGAGSNPDYTSIFTEPQYERLRTAIDEARAGGAQILAHEGGTATARAMRLTVVLRPPMTCALMRDEIFGPVLPIVPYETLDEAVAFVNGRDKPLALYCLTHDRASCDGVLGRTTSGGATINGLLLHQVQEDLPFGGVGSSGMGAYHGRTGFQRFSHARSVHHVRFVNVLRLTAPPYGRFARLIVRGLGSRRASEACRLSDARVREP